MTVEANPEDAGSRRQAELAAPGQPSAAKPSAQSRVVTLYVDRPDLESLDTEPRGPWLTRFAQTYRRTLPFRPGSAVAARRFARPAAYNHSRRLDRTLAQSLVGGPVLRPGVCGMDPAAIETSCLNKGVFIVTQSERRIFSMVHTIGRASASNGRVTLPPRWSFCRPGCY